MRLLMLSLTLLSLAGCTSINTTRSLVSLQTEFADLVQIQSNCKNSDKDDRKPGKGGEECLADFTTMHGLIETQAIAEIGKLKESTDPGDQQIKIALYRLAAFASLKADTNKVSDYGDKGSQLCTSLKDKAPPRDCALLLVVGQYEVTEAFANSIDCLKAKNCSKNLVAAKKPDAEKLVDSFCAIRKNLLNKSNIAKQQLLLDDSVAIYIDRQVANLDTSLDTLDAYLRGDVKTSKLPKQPCDCIKLDPADSGFTAKCGQLPDDETRTATFKAMCIRKNINASESCPTI